MCNSLELEKTTETFKTPQKKKSATEKGWLVNSKMSSNSARSVSFARKINSATWLTISTVKTSWRNQRTTEWLSSLRKTGFSASRFETLRTCCFKVRWRWRNARTSFCASAAKRTSYQWRCANLDTKTRPCIAWNSRRRSKLAAGGKVITSVADDYLHFLDPSQIQTPYLTTFHYLNPPTPVLIDGSI
jgi:hypothetical protein